MGARHDAADAARANDAAAPPRIEEAKTKGKKKKQPKKSRPGPLSIGDPVKSRTKGAASQPARLSLPDFHDLPPPKSAGGSKPATARRPVSAAADSLPVMRRTKFFLKKMKKK